MNEPAPYGAIFDLASARRALDEVERELTHTRRVRYEGYRRSDGLWDIEGHITDEKHYLMKDEDWRGDLRPGEYPVILEEYAVGELVDYLAYMGFGALSFQEGHGFMAGRLGQRLMSEQISIWDDGLDGGGLPMAFDFEGVPRQRVDLIREGVAAGVVYDTETAAREGRESTGHALPAPNPYGPFPLHLFVGAGDTPKEAMLKSMDRGLWVTRFHYVNVVHSRQGILTGMTRDGTFLMEGGELTRPVRNLRFTQNALEALSATEAVGATRLRLGGAEQPLWHLLTDRELMTFQVDYLPWSVEFAPDNQTLAAVDVVWGENLATTVELWRAPTAGKAQSTQVGAKPPAH